MDGEAKCSCAKFGRLEGASVPAYVRAFLEEIEGGGAGRQERYRCRVCGREWEKRQPEGESGGRRPSLVRVS